MLTNEEPERNTDDITMQRSTPRFAILSRNQETLARSIRTVTAEIVVS
jgi:hypothetical protein